MTFPDADAVWSFAFVVAILTVTPGVDTALVLRSAAAGGQRRAWGAVSGVQCGVLSWAVLASVGVGAVLAASQLAYDVLRLVGALYLLWLGGRLIWSALRGTAHLDAPPVEARSEVFRVGWRQGLLTNLLNPKVGAFYVALLPQLIPTSAPALVWGVVLGLVHVLLGTLWFGALVLAARRARNWLRHRSVLRWLDGVVGAVIAGFGLRLALIR